MSSGVMGNDWVSNIGSTLGNALGIGFSSVVESSDVGAVGGYLIYPNKPNNNSAVVVHRK